MGALLLLIAQVFFRSQNHENLTAQDYLKLTEQLKELSSAHLSELTTLCRYSAPQAKALGDGLAKYKHHKNIKLLVEQLEKEPYGTRKLEDQFSTADVERIVNKGRDLIAQSAHSYQYNKKLAEAFLFVNQAGRTLPLYNNKAAKDLSNAELQELFQGIKANKPDHLDFSQRRLYALPLIREAMYRATNKFPNQAQMIALIDSTMHEGDVISGIDTGRGKSLVDTMKAALLWTQTDRVDLTTSSLVDAQRDINIYSPCLDLLGIANSKKAITSQSPLSHYQTRGINISTVAQLSLFKSKAIVEGVDLDKDIKSVSLIMNESDFSILDDRTIYRYASTHDPVVHFGDEWIYYAINQFIASPEFQNPDSSEEQDCNALRKVLETEAISKGKLPRLINKYNNDQLLAWIESALIVKYKLKDNTHYVIPDEPELRLINGVMRQTKAVKILMKDGRVNPDVSYGNGMQQLLYAALNTEAKQELFVIEPETQTILSTINKNFIDYYRARKGFIWGSTATPGSAMEIDEQYQKYGIQFSKTEPQEPSQITFEKTKVFKTEEEKFEVLRRHLCEEPLANLEFFKDIDTAKRFQQYLKTKGHSLPWQMFLGYGHEEEVIKNAGRPGMSTITTPALGRNTDVPYDKEKGMAVYKTFVSSTRGEAQKDGRTGRQGSYGRVFTFLDEKDLAGLTPEQIRLRLDEQGQKERLFNEELYDLLDPLFNFIRAVPDEHFAKDTKLVFIKTHWARFCDQRDHCIVISYSTVLTIV